MSKVLIKIKNNLKYTFVTFFILSFFFGGISFARTDDILGQIMLGVENRDISVDMGDTPNEVGTHVFEEGTEASFGDGVRDATSVIVKLTRLLLSLVVVIAVTMILYNGMSYIIQTGQGKEGKDLVSNIIYIVVGILIALFSVTIITIIQSVGPSIEDGTTPQTDNREDNELLKGKYVSVGTYITDKFTELING